jgi:hypothetical protein
MSRFLPLSVLVQLARSLASTGRLPQLFAPQHDSKISDSECTFCGRRSNADEVRRRLRCSIAHRSLGAA